MERVNAHLIRKTDDIPHLKSDLITLSAALTHRELVEYALRLGQHILDFNLIPLIPLIHESFEVLRKWQDGQARFQDALETAGQLNRWAKEPKDPIQSKAYRALGQIAASPHVRWHVLAASEYVIVLLNLRHPHNLEIVEEERKFQVNLMESCRVQR